VHAEAADAVWNELSTGHTDAGKAGQQLWTDVDAILADTGELQVDDYPTSIAAVQTTVDSILQDTDGTHGVQLATDSVDADALKADAATEIASAVWDDQKAGHTDANSFGKILQDLETDLATVDDNVDDILLDTATSGVVLAADSVSAAALKADAAAEIADAVWDEALAAHDAEDSVGNVINDMVEESDGTYRLTAAAMNAGAGPGAYTCTLNIKDDDGNNLESVAVWISTDEAGNNVIAGVEYTSAAGNVEFMLDYDVAYWRWCELDGYNFDNPKTFTPSA